MHIRDVVRRPSGIGVMVGAILLGLSLTPSLIPRSMLQQAIIGALSFVSGYGLAVAFNALWRYLGLPTIAERHRAGVTLILLALTALLLAYFMFQSLGWQNNVRETVQVEPVDSSHALLAVLGGLLIAAALLIFLRLIWWIVVFVADFVAHYIPRRYGQVIGSMLGVVLVIILLSGTLVDGITSALNSSYALTDSETYENVDPPTSALRTGSPDSLIPWETLGREGQRFVGTGPGVEDLADYWEDESVMEPIRVYVGDKSAATLDERVQLALDELIRTDAFERDLLLLVTPTGNGWVDGNALDSLEYMHRGNTAAVGFQYSYLPSVYAMVADPDAATDASTAMFNAVHQYWQSLDKETRPEFYFHGWSLGAYGPQAAVSSVNLFNDPIHGALWAGPPFVSHFWRQLTDDRDPGTPFWRPIYDSGRTVRFTNAGEGLEEALGEWQDNRFIYLQQAGDPIVFFTIDSFIRQPEWLDEESRSPKAPSEMRWYPIVTFWQLVFDMVLATSDTLPDGNGHRYPSTSYIDGWAVLTHPENWSDEQTEDFKDFFSTLGNPNKP